MQLVARDFKICSPGPLQTVRHSWPHTHSASSFICKLSYLCLLNASFRSYHIQTGWWTLAVCWRYHFFKLNTNPAKTLKPRENKTMSHVTWKCSRHLDTYVWNVLYFVNVALHRGEGEIRRRTRVSGECWVQSEVDLNPNAPTQSGCLERITNQATKQFICEFMLHKLQKHMYSYYYTNIHICKQQQQYGNDNVVVWTSSIDVSNTESSSAWFQIVWPAWITFCPFPLQTTGQ